MNINRYDSSLAPAPALPPRSDTSQLRPLPPTPTAQTTYVASLNSAATTQQPSVMDRVNTALASTRAYANKTNNNVFSSPKRSTAALVSACFGVGLGSCGGFTGAMAVPAAVGGFIASGNLCQTGTASDAPQEQSQQTSLQQPRGMEPMQVGGFDQRRNDFLTSNVDERNAVLPPIPQTRI